MPPVNPTPPVSPPAPPPPPPPPFGFGFWFARLVVGASLMVGLAMGALAIWGATHQHVWPLLLMFFSILALIGAVNAKSLPSKVKKTLMVLAVPTLGFILLFPQLGLFVQYLFRRLRGYRGRTPLFSIDDPVQKQSEADWLARQEAARERHVLGKALKSAQKSSPDSSSAPSRRRL